MPIASSGSMCRRRASAIDTFVSGREFCIFYMGFRGLVGAGLRAPGRDNEKNSIFFAASGNSFHRMPSKSVFP